MEPLTILPFVLLLAAVLGLWLHRTIWMTALLAAVIAGYLSGALRDLAAVWIAIAALLCWVYARSRGRAMEGQGRVMQWVAGVVLAGYGLAMALPLLPGFVRVELAAAQELSVGAAPYALAVGFPKVTLGILLLGLVTPASLSRQGIVRILARTTPVFGITLLLVMTCALALGYTAFAPHWAPLFLWWAPINLFFTCMAEEAFFRGFIQGELAAGTRGTRAFAALLVSALLFGLAHFAGGPVYVFAGVVAGLGYGWAFLRTGRIEAAMAVHFGVNAAHFLLFVYPRLA